MENTLVDSLMSLSKPGVIDSNNVHGTDKIKVDSTNCKH